MVKSKGESGPALEWPYPVNYDVEHEVSTDVLVLGGGIAGCHAAINAARKGAKVIVVDKGPVITSGSGGAGVDHWQLACTSPCCKVTPEEMTQALFENDGQYEFGIYRYIQCKESYDALLDCEKMGLTIRDIYDEFKGAEFRDEKTKLMFAYDYENKYTISVPGGAHVKRVLYNELKRLGVEIYNWVMATSLLTEKGKLGARVVGATGVNVRSGEFYVFKAKATILCMANANQLWIYSTESCGYQFDPNCTGEGYDMAWKAGAEFALMEQTRPAEGNFAYPTFGVGMAAATWHGCTIVDANGKEVPWVDRDGRVLETVSERFRPAPGQKFFLTGGGAGLVVLGVPSPIFYKYIGPSLTPDLPDRIQKGELVLPLYADLPAMPELERRHIFGMMVGNEGKTRVPIYINYTRSGFDPDKDMLQAPVFTPAAYKKPHWSHSPPPVQWRETGFCCGGGVVTDWDLRTNLEGLYAAGMQLMGGTEHSGAATTGRYAGRKAADYALKTREPVLYHRQVEAEKARVYAPVKRHDGVGWRELHAGIARIMQDYCGEYKEESTLKIGLRWLEEIRENEASEAWARNPHELMRTLECLTLLTVGEMTIHASLARKASSIRLDFKRIDYPETDPEEWTKFLTIKLEGGQVKSGELPLNYWLLPPYAPSYEENYARHCGY